MDSIRKKTVAATIEIEMIQKEIATVSLGSRNPCETILASTASTPIAGDRISGSGKKQGNQCGSDAAHSDDAGPNWRMKVPQDDGGDGDGDNYGHGHDDDDDDDGDDDDDDDD